ncbi:F-box/FBD/LRR-repeat protein At1g13570-like isoform X2 [Diospyros lotus]|uniref:F-box/FBD/LRR-repeat protein At1g13570-like isoform X2 n=1 Tax=Diospyros lotus TaxID=55363 RepID=UPI0022527767|nr:F-box/FBD/LRR-repeat protein At1g13570-like isoform X2 [Diospyros lotus]
MQGSNSDIISHLPSNVIEEILMRMPIQDAVRTSVLSKKWRYAWVTLPQLVFDDAFYIKSRTQKNKLMMAIYQVLLLHRGPILKFKLSLSILDSCFEIDQLILFVSNNGIQEFVLDIQKGEPYKLPSSFFSCLQLKHLELRSCLFNPPLSFKGFSRLSSLELWDVVITSKVFSSLISSCPLLEELKLVNSTSISYLEISAPNLTYLFFQGRFGSICFKNTPKLARVSVYLYESMTGEAYKGGEICNWVTFFAGLPVIEFLELDYGCLQLISAGGVPKRLPINLNHLKILKLHLEKVKEVSSILCLVRSSPNLEKFVIWGPINGIADEETAVKLLEVHGWSDICLNQLQEVELREACGSRIEVVG